MTDIQTRIRVDPDHRISGTAPAAVPVGEHNATITIVHPRLAKQRPSVRDLPIHDLPRDGSVSLRRKDIYGDDGR
jgi:hypothetical protein